MTNKIFDGRVLEQQTVRLFRLFLIQSLEYMVFIFLCNIHIYRSISQTPTGNFYLLGIGYANLMIIAVTIAIDNVLKQRVILCTVSNSNKTLLHTNVLNSQKSLFVFGLILNDVSISYSTSRVSRKYIFHAHTHTHVQSSWLNGLQ